MIEFEILARGLYRPDQLIITYDPSLCMPNLGAQFIALESRTRNADVDDTTGAMNCTPTFTIQAWMDTLWQQKLATARENGIPLFDAPLFRLVSAKSQPDGTLHLVLGDTSYKEYVTTRVPEFAHGRTREELGNALSVCSVVETSDNYILLDKRQGVDVYVGRYHVIGGFFERDLDTTTRPDPFRAICREIREETGIQSNDIQEQYCLGVVYDLTTPHGEICFLTRLNITLAEVYRRTPEENEIKQLQSLYVTQESLKDFLLANHGNISATGEPNLLMYGGWKFGAGWLEEVLEQW